MKKCIRLLAALACTLLSQPGLASLDVFACEPEWGALVREIAGDKATVFEATTARQDPHHIEARPSLIARMRSADLLICTGLELESGWLPLLLQRAGNARLRPGGPAYLEVGLLVPRLDVPARLDRSDGDVHAAGNPHIHLDPRNIQRAADGLLARLLQIDGDHAAFYRQRHAAFSSRWQSAMERWQHSAAPLRGQSLVSHHRDMAYLLNWLGMKSAATLQPKPGVEPGGAHLAALLERLQASPPLLIVRTPFQSSKASLWLASRTGIPAVELPWTVGGDPQASDLFALFDLTLQRLLEARS